MCLRNFQAQLRYGERQGYQTNHGGSTGIPCGSPIYGDERKLTATVFITGVFHSGVMAITPTMEAVLGYPADHLFNVLNEAYSYCTCNHRISLWC